MRCLYLNCLYSCLKSLQPYVAFPIEGAVSASCIKIYGIGHTYKLLPIEFFWNVLTCEGSKRLVCF